jgi:hypothetical protein
MSCGGGHLGFPIGLKNLKFVEDLQMIIPGQFGFNCPSSNILFSETNELTEPKFLFFMPIGNPRWPPSQDID